MATPKKGAKAKTDSTTKQVVDNSPEAKAQRFKTIASRRTQKIIVTLGNLSNCANKNVYSYTQEQVAMIFDAIEKAFKESKAKFAEKDKVSKEEFKLS